MVSSLHCPTNIGTGTNSTDYSCTATCDTLDLDPEALNHASG